MLNIKEFKKQYIEEEKKANHIAILKEIANRSKEQIQKDAIADMADEIRECIELGQFLLDHGHSLKGREWGGSFLKGESVKHFMTDGWFHMLGFYVQNGKIIGIGKEAGGYCGDINLLIDENGRVRYYREHRGCGVIAEYGWWQEAINDFVDGGFAIFKARLEAYAEVSLENVKPNIKVIGVKEGGR